jgi:predicted transcriptional regulator
MEYAFLRIGFDSGVNTLILENENNLVNLSRIWNIEKRSKYYAITTKVRYILTICINNFNTKFLRDFSLTKQKCNELLAKHLKTRPITTREDIIKLIGFRLKKGIIIK